MLVANTRQRLLNSASCFEKDLTFFQFSKKEMKKGGGVAPTVKKALKMCDRLKTELLSYGTKFVSIANSPNNINVEEQKATTVTVKAKKLTKNLMNRVSSLEKLSLSEKCLNLQVGKVGRVRLMLRKTGQSHLALQHTSVDLKDYKFVTTLSHSREMLVPSYMDTDAPQRQLVELKRFSETEYFWNNIVHQAFVIDISSKVRLMLQQFKNAKVEEGKNLLIKINDLRQTIRQYETRRENLTSQLTEDSANHSEIGKKINEVTNTLNNAQEGLYKLKNLHEGLSTELLGLKFKVEALSKLDRSANIIFQIARCFNLFS